MLITYDESQDCLRIYEYVDESKMVICYDVFNYCGSNKWETEGMIPLVAKYPFRSMRELRLYMKELSDTTFIHDDGDL
jgi:hypothetical protein